MERATSAVEAATAWAAERLAPFGLESHAALSLAVAAGLAAIVLGLILRLVLRPKRAKLGRPTGETQNVSAERRRSAPEGAVFVIAVSKFADDPRDAAHQAAVEALQRVFAGSQTVVLVAPAPGRGAIDRAGAKLVAETDAVAVSRAARAGADVVVWGQALEGGAGLRLRIRPVSGGAAAWARAAEETLSLPSPDGEAAVVAFAAAVVASASPEEGRRTAFVAGPLAAAARLAAASEAEVEALARLGALDRCRVQEALARLALRRFAETGDADALERGILAADSAVADGRRATAPNEWAAAQAIRGLCWAVKAARDGDRPALGLAAAAFSNALGVADAPRTALARARLCSDLGEARLALAADDSGLAGVEEAAKAFETAADLFDRNRHGGEAVVARFGLARALAVLGEREAGVRRLTGAIAAFDAALDGVDAEADPEGWSEIQIARARSLTALGRRERGVERLDEAIKAFRAALALRDPRTDRAGWADAQAGLGAALEALGERERGADHLNEAVSALLSALRAAEEAGQPGLAASVRRDLVRAERLLAERRASRVGA